MFKSRSQAGFTLIEALIAFIVLTVGILGALLFHSNLLKESGNSKARLEATAIAEKALEDARSLLASSASASDWQTQLSTVISGSVPGKYYDTYDITFSTSAVSGATSDVAKLSVSVEPSGGGDIDAITLSSFFGWMDPRKALSSDQAGGGDSGSYSSDSLPVPTGTLKELPRLEIVDPANMVSSEAQGSLVTYSEGDVRKVAVEVADDVYVNLAQLANADNEIFLITGRIYNHPDDKHKVHHKFGTVYGVSELTYKSFSSEKRADFFYEEATDYYYESDILDISATGGANCIIGRYENSSSLVGTGSNKLYPGKYADYLCVAGTGWNGSIYPYLRKDFDALKSGDISIDGTVCAPKKRSYRYYILSTVGTANRDNLQQLVSVGLGSVSAGGIRDKIDSVASLAGQSGMVRFYDTEANLSAYGGDESVLWGKYFFHNPNYLIDPSYKSASAPADSLSEPLLMYGDGGHAAKWGYRGPKVTSTSSTSYELMFPGDIAHQNFYLTTESADCETGLDSVLLDADNKETIANYYTPASDVDPAVDFEDPLYLATGGQPGFIASTEPATSAEVGGYVPAFPNLVQADFNDYPKADGSGVIVLGYTLATESISGTLYYTPSSAVSSASDSFAIVGQPEPAITITCSIDESELKTDGDYVGYEYSCAVPTGWTGSILAYPVSTAAASLADDVRPADWNNFVACLPGEVNDKPAYASVASPSDSSPESVYYYYWLALGQPSSTVYESLEYTALDYYSFESEVVTEQTGNDFKYSKDVCP